MLQLVAHLETVDRGQVEPRLVAAPPTLARALGGVEGEVGLAEHLGGAARPGCGGHADAHRRRHPGDDVEGRHEGVDDPCRDLLDLGGVRGALDEDRELVAAEPRRDVVGAQGGGEASGDGDQQLVARSVPHRVVDELEVVEVDQEDPHDPAVVGRECTLHPVAEQDPVREPGERVVVGPVGELVLELPLFGHVPHGEHDPADGGIVPEVARDHLDVDTLPVGAQDLVAARSRSRLPGPHGAERPLGGVAFDDEIDGSPPHRRARAEQRLRRRAGVPDEAAVVDDQDHVVGVLDERPEVRLVVAPGHLLAQGHALDREGGLGGEHLQSTAEGEQNRLGGGDDEEPDGRPGGGAAVRDERAHQRRREPLHLPGGRAVEGLHVHEPARLVRGAGSGTGHAGRLAVDEQHRAVRRVPRDQAADRRAQGGGDGGGVGGRHQVGPGRAQGAFTLDRLPVPCDDAGQPGQDDQEQQRRTTPRSSSRG